mgnify:CR=1 FL=1
MDEDPLYTHESLLWMSSLSPHCTLQHLFGLYDTDDRGGSQSQSQSQSTEEVDEMEEIISQQVCVDIYMIVVTW